MVRPLPLTLKSNWKTMRNRSPLQKQCPWDQTIRAHSVKSLCFKIVTKTIIFQLAKKKLYANSNSLKPYTVRDIFYMTARLFTSKKAEKLLRGREVDMFQRFLCVWSKSTAVTRKWMLFRHTGNWNNVEILKIIISWSI